MSHLDDPYRWEAWSIRQGHSQWSLTHKPDIFVCGHSHLLLVQSVKAWGGIHLNPGAAGMQGFHRKRTLLRFNLANGQILAPEVVELGQKVIWHCRPQKMS